jgi:ankyrin repeat protein
MGSQLHRAAASGERLAVQGLLASGIAVDSLDENNSTPLHLAAMAGHVQVIATLLGSGAQVNADGRRFMWPPYSIIRRS